MNTFPRTSALAPAYWAHWNSDEQARIDAAIDANRKTDVALPLGLPAGTAVNVQQLTHTFRFGAHLFNFNQLGSDDANARHQALFGHDNGALFNSATLAFYWRTFEQVEGQPRFAEGPTDTAAWWNACKEPALQYHWRRPPTDPCLEFCEKKNIWRHGHPLVWANRGWNTPPWYLAKLPASVLGRFLCEEYNDGGSILRLSPNELAALAPEFSAQATALIRHRLATIAKRYGNRINSWDVCNESATDFEQGRLQPGTPLCQSYHRTLMPGDYCHFAFQTAMETFPSDVGLFINDYHIQPSYKAQILDQLSRGDRISCQGLQMHLFNPTQCADLAAGITFSDNDLCSSPTSIRAALDSVRIPNMPMHLSEITITSPGSDARGEHIQAILTRNLYRIWFSEPQMQAITWWNTVDGCGAHGEPAVSGILHRDGTPKASHDALDELINHEWKTSLTTRADDSGSIAFRGFRGSYRISWRDPSGAEQSTTINA